MVKKINSIIERVELSIDKLEHLKALLEKQSALEQEILLSKPFNIGDDVNVPSYSNVFGDKPSVVKAIDEINDRLFLEVKTNITSINPKGILTKWVPCSLCVPIIV